MKFEVGEVAILVHDLIGHNGARDLAGGREVIVIGIGPFKIFGGVFEYKIDVGDTGENYRTEDALRKRKPPHAPAEEEFQQDLKRWLGKAVEA